MAIKLTWKGGNVASTTINIFRAEGSTIDPNIQGTPLATVPGNVVTYTDNTAVLGVQYSYLVEARTANNFVRSKPMTQTNLRQRGPGAMSIIRGTPDYGYLGPVATEEVPDILESLRAVATGQTLTTLNEWAGRVTWYKFIRKNKIYLVPNQPIGQVIFGSNFFVSGCRQMFVEGIASGLTWNFDTSASKYDVYRKTKTVTSPAGWKFHLRSPRGYADDWAGVPNTDLGDKTQTEMAHFILPMYRGVAFDTPVGNVTPYNTAWRSKVIAAESIDMNVEQIMLDFPPVSNNLIPVTAWNTLGVARKDILSSTYNGWRQNAFLPMNSNLEAPMYWPVLELIEG